MAPLSNEKILGHQFLGGMYGDGYFPDHLVDRVKDVLLDLCSEIEARKPATDDALLELTHRATERINELQEAFEDAGSEIETVAREVIAEDFDFIVKAYGFSELDIEDVIAPRDW